MRYAIPMWGGSRSNRVAQRYAKRGHERGCHRAGDGPSAMPRKGLDHMTNNADNNTPENARPNGGGWTAYGRNRLTEITNREDGYDPDEYAGRDADGRDRRSIIWYSGKATL